MKDAEVIGTAVILTSRLNASAIEHVAEDVSHAYAGVFVVAMILIAAIVVPVSFLPKKLAPRIELIRVDTQQA